MAVIPGMGPEDKVDLPLTADGEMAIPGLDLDLLTPAGDDKGKAKKVPYSKPIPRNFQAQWNETAGAGKYKTAKKELGTHTHLHLNHIEPQASLLFPSFLVVHLVTDILLLFFTFIDDTTGSINDVISQIVENTPGVVPLEKIAPNAIIIYGKYIPVHRKLHLFIFGFSLPLLC